MANPSDAPGLWSPTPERDACGVGLVVDRSGHASSRPLAMALAALARLSHRGAVDADGRTGDGAGVTTSIPRDLLADELAEAGRALPSGGFGTGLVFLPRRDDHARVCRRALEAALAGQGSPWVAWRRPVLRPDALGEKARRTLPEILQVLAGRPAGVSDDEFENRLFLARKDAQRRLRLYLPDRFHVVSLSHRVLVYKALVRGVDLSAFYADLENDLFATPFAVFHQRYSTNTSPSWALAQPFRMLAHNGEINTIAGNRAKMEARETAIAAAADRGGSAEAGAARSRWLPLLEPGGSDSAHLDNAAELLVRGGRSLVHAAAMLLPPAWENERDLPRAVREFHEYHAGVMEPWDGPALAVFCDGVTAGAAMDRNGLRPARTLETRDGLFVLASEAGAAAVAETDVARRGRLGPGEMVAVDLATGELSDADAIRERLARGARYGARVARRRRIPVVRPAAGPARPADESVVRLWKAFGYTREEMLLVLGPMYAEGREPIGSMGDDAPLAVFSGRRLLFSFFKQRFAQVTNPPIDPLREAAVMSGDIFLGPEGDPFSPEPEPPGRMRLESPVLAPGVFDALVARELGRAARLDTTFPASGGEEGFRRAVAGLAGEAVEAVRRGAWLVAMSDRAVGPERAALPSLLAAAAVHQALVRAGLRPRASVLLETGEIRDEHQLAAALAFGADAVHPWLALETLPERGGDENGGGRPDSADDPRLAVLERGLKKILSKMGISTVRSYVGAKLFEAIGLSQELVDEYFPGAGSPIGGIGIAEIAAGMLARHAAAFFSLPEVSPALDEGGVLRFRRGGEPHAYAPDVVRALHAAVEDGDPEKWEEYAAKVRDREPIAVRDALDFVVPEGSSVPLEEVEPEEAILERFTTAAMSVGALSPEAHETLAIAMNRIGGRSNSGEGGADPERFWTPLPSGDSANDRVKQVASARFGVTAAYLVSAEELQIKMAQGSKPGEGGQLPGHKVNGHIARLRQCPEGTPLISPPPHHDIYSIEDLAELVYDLKRVNPSARVGVKLVATSGIGTIATGVAKAFADAILVSGHDGGTGASPHGSVRNAGMPWEIGLAEAQQALVASGLRGRVRLQVDGGFKTGRDVVVAALLGAEEFAFGTAALVSAGCVMARQCHANTCPVGIATQREDLRRKFRPTPETVVRFFRGVAREAREILARLGCRTLDEAVGRTELLAARPPAPGSALAAASLDLSRIVPGPCLPEGPRRRVVLRNDPPETGSDLDGRALARWKRGSGGPVPAVLDFPITNSDRAVGARIAGELARPGASEHLPARVVLRFHGTAGQAFGAFCVDRMRLTLDGDANDHVGKGMSGGVISIAPARSFPRPHCGGVLAGNAVLYGATGGRLFLAGRAGERFAVRNSGAEAVVEGVGDHGCEYMTAGRVVVLGPVGRNFAAGMSGGVAFVLDADGRSSRRIHAQSVRVQELDTRDARELARSIESHRDATASERAREILESWNVYLPLFRKVVPVTAAVAAVQPSAAPARRRPARATIPQTAAPPGL